MPCSDCYNVSTTGCGSQGCLETHYSNCIIYNGGELACAAGAINTITSSGVFDGSVTDTTQVSPTGGSGTGFKVNVSTTSGSAAYTITIADRGNDYEVGDTLTISGTDVNGSSPANDITITVISLAPILSVGMTMSEVIENLNSRLCTLTPSGLDYSGFSYSCLRQGGALTGLGTAITTAEQFTEAAAAALCAIHTRVLAVEKPTITVGCTSLVSGTSTLSDILNELISRACDAEASLDFSGVTADCFTTVPSSTVVNDWFQWVVDNVCDIKTTLEAADTVMDGRLDVIEDRLDDFDNAAYTNIPSMANNQTLETTMTNLLTHVNTMDASVDDLLAGTHDITLTYTSCLTGTATQPLVTHLDNIISQFVSYNFSGGLTATPSGCSVDVTLDPSYVFACSDLGSCSVNDLGNVDTTGVSTYDVMGYNGTNWVPLELDIVSADSSVTVTSTFTGSKLEWDLSVPANAPTTITFTPAGSGIAFDALVVDPLHVPTVKKTNETVVLDFAIGITSKTWTTASWLNVGTLGSGGIPGTPRYFQVTVMELYGSYGSFATIGRVNSSGAVEIYNNKTSTYTLVSPDTLFVSFAGQSYQV